MKLLLADDHTLFRDALLQYIMRAEPAAKITLAVDFHEVIEKLKESQDHDLIILDLRMPGMRGMEGFRRIRDEFPDIPVSLMSGVAEPKDVEAALALGAVGYFPKTMSGKGLLKAIQKVLQGERYVPLDESTSSLMPSYYADPEQNNVSPSAGYGYVQDAQSSVIEQHNSNLTPREMDVLEFLSKGVSNKEIANALDLKVVTVKLHVRGICRKLGAKNRTQAALRARELGIGS